MPDAADGESNQLMSRDACHLLDALLSHIVILNSNGVILFANTAWKSFARGNGAVDNVSEGVNYLAVCDQTQGVEAAMANSFARGIRVVLAGEREHFEMSYPCHGPDERRWVHVRPSGTEPVVRVMAEAPGREEAEELASWARFHLRED